MREFARVEQALCGYRGGHQVLASSVDLSPRVRQFLATVTDSSGSDADGAGEKSISGLLLPDTRYYALFCTWPAPEMSRPGCVWSHALLIDASDLARIPDLHVLTAAFRRPSVADNSDQYEVPMRVEVAARGESRVGLQEVLRVKGLLALLYSRPDTAVVVLDDECSPWESALFAVWSQQWPRLRRSFAFSTCSLGDRRATGAFFDIQIAPSSTQHLWSMRASADSVVVWPSVMRDVGADRSWLVTAAEDIAVGGDGDLRAFLFQNGSDIEAPRAAFASLVECFDARREVNSDTSTAQYLARVASSFPRPTDALTLKRETLAGWANGVREWDSMLAVFHILLRAPEASAFERVAVDFSPAVYELWRRKRADILGLMGSVEDARRGHDFVAAVAQAIAPADVPIIWSEQPDSLDVIARHRPSLAEASEAWGMPEAGQRQLWSSACKSTRDERAWSSICCAMLEARCSFAQQETVSLAGAALVSGLAEWVTSDRFSPPLGGWRQALRQPLADAVASAMLSPGVLSLAVWCIGPNSLRLSGERADVQALARDGFSGVPRSLRLSTAFWATALGLSTPGRLGALLLGQAFSTVHSALARSEYPGLAWELLAPALPNVSVWMEWDRCRTLRRGLRNWMHENPGHVHDLVEAAPDQTSARLIRDLW